MIKNEQKTMPNIPATKSLHTIHIDLFATAMQLPTSWLMCCWGDS